MGPRVHIAKREEDMANFGARMLMPVRAALLLSTAITPGAVWAQDGQTAANGDQGGIAEIVVTAQRREENLQDVPVSINLSHRFLEDLALPTTSSPAATRR